MTRRLPAKELTAHVALIERQLRGDIFKDAPAWQVDAAMAALYRFRPGLRPGEETAEEIGAHQVHMLNFWRNANYFSRVCRLLQMHGIGGTW